MSVPSVLFLVPAAEREPLVEYLQREAVLNWRSHVTVVPLQHKAAASEKKALSRKNTSQVHELLADCPYTRVVVFHSIPLEPSTFDDHPISIRWVRSSAVLLREAAEELRAARLDWLSHARRELGKSSLQTTSPEEWLRQFVALEDGESGDGSFKQCAKNLLRQLCVIPDQALRDAFSTHACDGMGLRVAHAYFKDLEKGSSSLAVQSVLEHLHPGTTYELDLDDLSNLPLQTLDRVYVYEDGLWSGVELVRRLDKLIASQEFKNSDTHFYFVFGATSDVGLAAARLFARFNKAARLHFSARPSHYYRFFVDGVDSSFADVASNAAVREHLDGLATAMAFRSAEVWGRNAESAMKLCREAGAQLVLPFLQRKAAAKGKPIDYALTSSDIEALALGAQGFASTVVFTSSVPKPVLPLMWLQGRVTLQGRTVEWKPLFGDVRRIGD